MACFEKRLSLLQSSFRAFAWANEHCRRQCRNRRLFSFFYTFVRGSLDRSGKQRTAVLEFRGGKRYPRRAGRNTQK